MLHTCLRFCQVIEFGMGVISELIDEDGGWLDTSR